MTFETFTRHSLVYPEVKRKPIDGLKISLRRQNCGGKIQEGPMYRILLGRPGVGVKTPGSTLGVYLNG